MMILVYNNIDETTHSETHVYTFWVFLWHFILPAACLLCGRYFPSTQPDINNETLGWEQNT